eukprot:9051561-Pyramimonas_sp.AAC.1
MDIITMCSQSLEIGRDRFDRVAIAAADIASHHDSLCISAIAMGLLARGISKAEIGALIQLHCLP